MIIEVGREYVLGNWLVIERDRVLHEAVPL